MTRTSLVDEARLKKAGLTIEAWGQHGYVLRDGEGYSLQILGYGGIAPTRWEAAAEGISRIEAGLV